MLVISASPSNLTGRPAASIPCGLTPDNLPVGLQVVAPLGGEATLISALRVLEATLGARMTIAGPVTAPWASMSAFRAV